MQPYELLCQRGGLLSKGHSSDQKNNEELIMEERGARSRTRLVVSSDIYDILFEGEDLVEANDERNGLLFEALDCLVVRDLSLHFK